MPKLNVQQNNANIIKAFKVALETSHRNLLDNWYFVGGGSQLGDGVFPINQRGQTSYSGGYGIDRWYTGGTVTVNSDSITITNNTSGSLWFAQRTTALPNATITGSAIVTAVSGNCEFVIQEDGNSWQTVFTKGVTAAGLITGTGEKTNSTTYQAGFVLGAGASVTVKAIKVELGTVSTLANDPPPDFGEELRKCQRYFMRITAKNGSRGYAGIGSANNNKNMLCFVPMPVVMRATPNVSFSNCDCYNFVSGGSIAISAINLDSWSENGVFVSCTPSNSSQVVQYQPYALRIASGGYVQFSAEI